MTRLRLAAAVSAVSALALTGCQVSTSSSPSTAATATDGTYRLVSYPQAGFGQFHSQINDATSSVHMWIYSLNDAGTENALIAAKKRGVDVKVILDSAFGGNRFNAHAYAHLRSAGVSVHWAPTGYIFHIKTTVFDGKTAAISTANLNAKNFADTRDATVVTTSKTQVDAIEKTFAGDWSAKGKPKEHTVNAPGLVWSPGADQAMLSAIRGAKHSIRYSSEELAYQPVVDALASVAKRGVKCTVVMTDDKEWHPQFGELAKAGCDVRLLRNSVKVLYIHEKIVLTDDSNLLIGSQNASMFSLTRNRELSIMLNKKQAPNVISKVASTFDHDAASATRFTG